MINKIEPSAVKIPIHLRLDGFVEEINKNFDILATAIQSVDAEGVITVPGKDGQNGKDGEQGPAGQDGKDGKDGANGADGLPGAMGAQGSAGVQGIRGEQGIQGIQGPAGKDGLPGATGPQGVSIVSAVVTNGNLIITKSDGTTVDAGKVSSTTTTTTTTTTAGGPPVVGGAMNPFAPVIVNAMQGYAAGYVNAGTFVQLDNLKFTVTTSGQRGLSCATVAGTVTLSISASYAMAGGSNGTATPYPGCVYNTTPSGSWFGWSFPNAGDTSTYMINDYTNKRFYRVHLSIGASYNNNFISIERLY